MKADLTLNGKEIARDLPLIDAPMAHHVRGLSYTRTGYGKRIPTRYKLAYNGRLYRVYCCIFSNVGTCFITVRGVDHIVSGV